MKTFGNRARELKIVFLFEEHIHGQFRMPNQHTLVQKMMVILLGIICECLSWSVSGNSKHAAAHLG